MNRAAGRQPPAQATLAVVVRPGASREGVLGALDNALKVAVCAPPDKGKANKAVERLIARELGLPAGAVRVVVGAGSRRKLLRLEGIEPRRLKEWLRERNVRTS